MSVEPIGLRDRPERPTDHVPWPEEVAARYVALGEWDERTLSEHVHAAARSHPDGEALVDGPRRWTHAELETLVETVGVNLRAAFDPGDRLLVQLPNRWEQVVTTLAALRAALVPVWALPHHGARELRAFAEHTGARGIVTTTTHRDHDTLAVALRLRAELPHLRHVVAVGTEAGGAVATEPGVVPFERLLERGGAWAWGLGVRRRLLGAPPADSVALVIPSGGTTGASKLVPRTHRDLVCMLRHATAVCGVDHTTRYLAVLPLGHGFVNTGPGVLGTLAAGGAVVIAASPAPEVALPLLVSERVSATSVVPAVLQRWLAHDDAPRASDLRLLQVGAARLDPAVARTAEARLGGVVQQVYGMSEGLMCATRPGDAPDRRHHTQGRPISTADELRVVGPDDEAVPSGEVGALLVRGPYTVRGYLDQPVVDARSFTTDGWYRTGDLVRLTADGDLVVVGREKDVINRGGESVSADEVETVAREHATVADAAAVATPSALLGEEVCLFVTPRPGCTVDVADLRAHFARAGLAPYKTPRDVVAIDRLPLVGIGKVDKTSLRALAAGPTPEDLP